MKRTQARKVSPGDVVLKIYGGTFGHDSRDQRELETVRELGLRAIVLTKDRRRDMTDEFDWEWQLEGTRPLGAASWLAPLNRVLSLLVWARRSRTIRPAVISGHDLIGTLIGWLSTWFTVSSQKPALIYDAHELTIGLYVGWRRRAISALEGFLMRRCVVTIAVNDAIADRMRESHRSVDRPVVVRSLPRRWHLDQSAISEHRQEFLENLGLGERAFILMYHGVVCGERGIEAAIQVLPRRSNVALVVLGDGDVDYLGDLRELAERLGVAQRVLFQPSVRLERLGEYVAAADAGMVTVPRTSESHYLMLPNKFFENVQAATPVIASDFPEVGAIVQRYDIGLLVDPSNIDQIGEAIDRLREDTILLDRFRENLSVARDELCWENEQHRLKDVYNQLMT